jgi:hypothetical protein
MSPWEEGRRRSGSAQPSFKPSPLFSAGKEDDAPITNCAQSLTAIAM